MGRARVIAAVAAASLAAAMATVVMAPSAGATDVSTEEELRSAYDTDAQVDLLNDITLDDCSAGALDRSSPDPVTIDGHGFAIIQTCSDNIIDNNTVDTEILNLTMQGGRDNDDGGAIDMNGNSVEPQSLLIFNSTFVDNCAADSAGAIENEDGDTLILGSTLSGNFAEDQAGALRSKRGATTIINSTVTQNRQLQFGAIDSGQPSAEASLTLIYDTIVDNANEVGLECPISAPASVEEDVDDDVDVAPQQFNPANVNAENSFATFGTVFALPGNGPNCDFPTTTSLGWNYADDDGLPNSCELNGEGDIANGADPQLGPLADNGGPTLTRLPAGTSPLLEQIPADECPGPDDATDVDQRGLPRPGFALCDIGSVELQPPPAPAPLVLEPAPLVLEPTFTG